MEAAALTELDDAALMREVAQDQVAALAVLYDRYANLVFSFAMRMVGDPEAARDVARQAFLLVWERRRAFAPDQLAFPAWLLSQVHDLGTMEARRRRASPQRAEPLAGAAIEDEAANVAPDLGAATAWETQLAGQRGRVRDALQALSREQRHTIELAFFQGYTQDEIARLSGESVDTVKSNLRLSLLRLHEVLQPMSVSAEP